MAGIGQLSSSAAAYCIAGAVAVHALAAGLAISASDAHKVTPPAGAPATALHTRILRQDEVAPVRVAAAALPPSATPVARAQAHRTAVPAPADVDAALLRAADAPADVSGTALSATPAVTSQADDYLPREVLTQAPSASTPVLLDFPTTLPDEQRLSIVLRLYVDELGVVRRIARVGAASQEEAQSIAEQAFMQARFNPGEVEGRPVKSIIHVEVTFDSTSLDPAH